MLYRTTHQHLRLDTHIFALAIGIYRIDAIVVKAFIQISIGVCQLGSSSEQNCLTIDLIARGGTRLWSLPSENNIMSYLFVSQITHRITEFRRTAATTTVDGKGLGAIESTCILVDDCAVFVSNLETAL